MNEENGTPKIPQSVIESLARATLSAMRKEKESSKSSERNDNGKEKAQAVPVLRSTRGGRV